MNAEQACAAICKKLEPNPKEIGSNEWHEACDNSGYGYRARIEGLPTVVLVPFNFLSKTPDGRGSSMKLLQEMLAQRKARAVFDDLGDFYAVDQDVQKSIVRSAMLWLKIEGQLE